MWLQWILGLFFRSKRGARLDLDAVSRISFRVWPTDIDLLMHMNNGRYLSYMDLGRVDLTERTGLAKTLSEHGIHAVVGAQTITYRKSLQLFQRFAVESRLIGNDDRAFYVEQRFVVRGEVYARAIVRGRLISKTKGTLKVADLESVTGHAWTKWVVAPEIAAWAEQFKLPATKADAPSTWDESSATALHRP